MLGWTSLTQCDPVEVIQTECSHRLQLQKVLVVDFDEITCSINVFVCTYTMLQKKKKKKPHKGKQILQNIPELKLNIAMPESKKASNWEKDQCNLNKKRAQARICTSIQYVEKVHRKSDIEILPSRPIHSMRNDRLSAIEQRSYQ